MPHGSGPFKGRGAGSNPAGRFERLEHVPISGELSDMDDLDLGVDALDEARRRPPTELLDDTSRSIITRNASPDVGFDASLNPYRGCEHGCAYCYARPTHEYLGFSAGLDFETRILVKRDAARLLREELSSPRWKPTTLALSGVTDAYQPVERRLGVTRACLEVLAELRNPVCVVTKNRLVTRDADLLASLARHGAAAVFISITTLRKELHRALEPRTSSPPARLDAIRELAAAGIPTGVMVAPIIPGLNDHEAPAILAAARAAGASQAGYVLLRLPHGLGPLFEEWLDRHAPERKERVLERIRETRGGRLNDPRFGSRMRGEGIYAEQIAALFKMTRKSLGYSELRLELSPAAFRSPRGRQLDLFEGE